MLSATGQRPLPGHSGAPEGGSRQALAPQPSVPSGSDATATTPTTTTTTTTTPSSASADLPSVTLSTQAQAVLRTNHDGPTRLAEAIAAGDLVQVRAVLAEDVGGLLVNQPAKNGALPLLLAVRKGRFDIAACLLAQGADIARVNRIGNSPLQTACGSDAPAAVEWLLQHGAATSVLTAKGSTLLHLALVNVKHPGTFDVLQRWLPKEEFLDMCGTANRTGSIPLSIAIERRLSPAVRQCLQPRAVAQEPLVLTPPNHRRCRIIVGGGFGKLDLSALTHAGTGLGMQVKTYGDGRRNLTWEGLKKLRIPPGDSVALVGHMQWDPGIGRLTVRLGDEDSVPLTDVVKLLLEKGVLNIFLTGCDIGRATEPLWQRLLNDPHIRRSVAGGYEGLRITMVGNETSNVTSLGLDAVRLWLQDGATQRNRGVAGNALERLSVMGVCTLKGRGTHLDYAERGVLDADSLPGLTLAEAARVKGQLLLVHALGGNLDAVTHLVRQHGVDPNFLGGDGAAALHIALVNGHSAVTRFLLEQPGLEIGRPLEGSTPLMLASSLGDAEAVEALLRKRARCDANDENGWTPLHFACENGHRKVVQQLLAAGADRGALTKDGETPQDLAPKRVADLLG